MSDDDPRDRIAAVLADEFKRQGYACEWAVLADAVITELGLHREDDANLIHCRYVTDWQEFGPDE